MSSINLHKNEIGIKIVYYGPGLGGKTSSLQYIHKVLKPENKGRMISLATGIDRTLYFDFLPVHLPKFNNFSVKMSIYTVPGQVHYNATRKLVLQGSDGLIFVADSQAARQDANKESLENLLDNLKTHGINPLSIPTVLQYNKRDLPEILSIEEMEKDLNPQKLPFFESNAILGEGVFAALKTITKLILSDLKKKGLYGKSSLDSKQDEESDLSNTMHKTTREDLEPKKINEHINKKNGHKNEISTSIEKAIVNAAESSMPQNYVHIDTNLSTPYSCLWNTQEAKYRISIIENMVRQELFGEAVKECNHFLKQHLKECGNTQYSLEEALLITGAVNFHYVRFKEIVLKSDLSSITRAEALFCLFFLTDVELRIQATGIMQ